jgi:hypothetical protein
MSFFQAMAFTLDFLEGTKVSTGGNKKVIYKQRHGLGGGRRIKVKSIVSV